MLILSMSSKLRGGAFYVQKGNILNKNRNRKFNSSDPEIKITNQACSIYLDKNGARAQMPCGHVFSSKSMFDTLKGIAFKST